MRYTIGLDIGGTKINGVVWDGKKVVRELTIVIPKNLFEFERNLLKLVDFLSVGKKITAIGVGMAGVVDSKLGLVKRSPNIKFVKDLQLAKFFKANGFSSVKVDNDASCFTRAEMLVGQGKKYNNFLAMTLGTGVGGGIVINGQLYRGSSNYGGEFGHMVLGNGFLEKTFQQARDKRDFKHLGEVLGKAMASLIKIFDPQAIILGGSVSFAASKFLPSAHKQIAKFVPHNSSRLNIIISKLKNAGAIGGALMFKN